MIVGVYKIVSKGTQVYTVINLSMVDFFGYEIETIISISDFERYKRTIK